jgi:hypothetical protein
VDRVLDLGLVAWVARSPVALLAVGFLLLGFAPQAQDLLIPLVDGRYYAVGLFFPLVFLLWSMPTRERKHRAQSKPALPSHRPRPMMAHPSTPTSPA